MLPRVHRIAEGSELRRVSRKGIRRATPFFVASVSENTGGPSRFGFVVSRQVGGAVTRNRVKRRLRDIAARSLETAPVGHDVVIRALPAAATASFVELSDAWRKAFPA